MQVRYALGPPRKRGSFSIPIKSILALTTMYIVASAIPAWAQQPAGAARVVVNDVTGTVPRVRERTTVRVGDNLVQNEVIDTAANSATRVAFRDDSQLAICPSAEVVLERAEFGESSVGPTLVVFIPIGCMQFASGPLMEAILFRTPSAEVRPYGTILTVTVSARGGTTVSVAEGTASVTGAGRSVTVAAGQSTLVARGAAPTPPVPTPPQPPIVTEMNTLLMTASAQDFGTRAAARSPAVEAPTDAGTHTFTPNVDGKIQSEIAGDATPAFGSCTGSAGSLECASRGTHGAAGSRGTHGSAGSRGTH
jgi:hypothetical protein